MKKLTKALKGTIKKLEVKDLAQLKELSQEKLTGFLSDLNKCYDYDMNEEENETVETLIEDINGILVNKLADSVLAVADKKEVQAPAKKGTSKGASKGTKKEAPTKTDKTTKADKAPTKATKETKAPTKETPAPTKKKAPAKKEAPAKTVYDLIQWKSIIEMNDNEGSIYNVYVVDIHPDKKDCICRGFDNKLLVFQFLEDELKKGVYVDTNNISWKLTVKGKAE